MRLMAIDPGPEQSAWLIYDTDEREPVCWDKMDNLVVRSIVHGESSNCSVFAVEMIASYGMAVGREVFQTCVEIGRFVQCWVGIQDPLMVYRREVKLHLCGSARAKDANIRQALIDRYGPSKEQAIGRKASPGPLYGLSGDCWSALAVAVTVADTAALEAAA